jgi:argininosuccinate lyase
MGLADYLTRKGVPFREAHGVVGKAVREAERQGMALRDVSLESYRAMHERFGPDVFDALRPEALVADKDVIGGTAPARVREEIKRLREQLGKSKTE